MTQPVDNPLIEFVDRYRGDPVLFVQEVLGVEPDEWQKQLMQAVANGHRRIAVRSGHGVGKSTCASWIMLWHILTRFPQKTVVTSQSAPQLFDALFAEVKKWVKNLPPVLAELLEAKAERIELLGSPTESFISARTSRAESPEALAGVHSENVMLIGDEASGIPEQVYEAAYGSMSGMTAVTILLGNPIRSSGFFHDVFNRPELASDWFLIHVNCNDCSRVSKEFINDIKARYGEDSNVYRVRVLGEFPRADDDTIIPIELIEAAIVREVTCSPTTPIVWGLDVARFGSDSSCLVKRQGNIVPEPPRVWQGLDTMQTVGIVRAEWDATSEDRRPVEILVDVIGVGSGVCDRLRELGLPARGINVSELPSMTGVYANLRAELWFQTKEWFARRECKIPDHPRLKNELATIRYGFQKPSNKMKAESKDEMKARGLRSPDCADALVLCFASDAGIALHGRSSNSQWNKPVSRNLGIF